jgi:hypothetical protein
MERFIIDRFEGDYAVMQGENGQMINVKRSKLPPGVKEGDVVARVGSGWVLSQRLTAGRKEVVKRLMDDVWADESTKDLGRQAGRMITRTGIMAGQSAQRVIQKMGIYHK